MLITAAARAWAALAAARPHRRSATRFRQRAFLGAWFSSGRCSMFRYAILNQAGTEVTGFQDYPAPLPPDAVPPCDDGNPSQRPLEDVTPTLQSWQTISGQHYDIEPDK